MEAFLNKPLSNKKTSSVVEEKPSTSGHNGKKGRPIPWVEKYRPKSVDDIAYQDEVVAVLRKTITDGADLPNLLFYGPPGTGKTSTILAVTRQLFGATMFRERVLELNASDERGIQVVREKVKNFAQLSASAKRPDGKSCPSFKVVILDEADSMTSAAQAALRRIMEKQSKTTRFCLICNYVSRIIEPLTSRCSKFRFKPLADDILRSKLKDICEMEKVAYDEECVNTILSSSEGDMRRAITILQSVSTLPTEATITQQDVLEISGIIPGQWIEGIVDVCRSGSYEQLQLTIKELMLEGYSAYQVIIQLHDLIVPLEDINDTRKSKIMEKLAIVDKRLIDGADEYLQIMDLCTVILNQLSSR